LWEDGVALALQKDTLLSMFLVFDKPQCAIYYQGDVLGIDGFIIIIYFHFLSRHGPS
jgi:hypothetical protein